jgi:hypothetical protein
MKHAAGFDFDLTQVTSATAFTWGAIWCAKGRTAAGPT